MTTDCTAFATAYPSTAPSADSGSPISAGWTRLSGSVDWPRIAKRPECQRLRPSSAYVCSSGVIHGDGIRVAVFYTKLQNRLLRPLLEADKPPAKIEIRRALATLHHAVQEYVENARLTPAT